MACQDTGYGRGSGTGDEWNMRNCADLRDVEPEAPSGTGRAPLRASLDHTPVVDRRKPKGTRYFICAKPVWEVPPHGPVESAPEVRVLGLTGTGLAYVVGGGQPARPPRVYYRDLSTGLERRLTWEARQGGVGPVRTASPYAIYTGLRSPTPTLLSWVVNQQVLGVVGDEGHLLEGPPLDELTELADPL